MSYQFRFAQTEHDWQQASALLLQVHQQLCQQQGPLWQPQELSVAALKRSYQHGELLLALHQQQLAALVFLLPQDPLYWPELDQQSPRWIIHKLVADSQHKGLGKTLLLEVLKQAQLQGKDEVLLDHDHDREKLHQLYKSAGFCPLDTLVVHEPAGYDVTVCRMRYKVPVG